MRRGNCYLGFMSLVPLASLASLAPSRMERARASPASRINSTGVCPFIREAVSITHPSSKLIMGLKRGRGLGIRFEGRLASLRIVQE